MPDQLCMLSVGIFQPVVWRIWKSGEAIKRKATNASAIVCEPANTYQLMPIGEPLDPILVIVFLFALMYFERVFTKN